MNAKRFDALIRPASDALLVERVAPHVLRLCERAIAPAERSFFHLVEGRDRDCLIDGGWGLAADLGTLRDPTKPLVAIATHSHFDHVGLLHLAPHRLAHAAETGIYARCDPIDTQALPYLDGRRVLADGSAFDPATFLQLPCPLHGMIGEGDRIELGGVTLSILHTPGHSPGSITVLDEASGLLFPADTAHDGHIWDDIPGADPHKLLLSQSRLAEVDFALALPGHGAILDPADFRQIIERYRTRNA